MSDIKLSSGSFYLNDKFLTDKFPMIEIPDEPFPQYVKSFNLVDPTAAECTFEAEIDVPMIFRSSFIFDASKLPSAQSFTAEFSEPYQEQRRKHKKKRINKKWAKRYGYVTKFRKWRIKEISLMNNGMEFEATGRNIELIKR